MTPGTSNVRTITGSKSTIASQIKPLLSEQHHRLQAKHGYDMDLMDDLRNFIKTKCDIEKHYAQGIIKLTTTHQKKYPSFEAEKDSDLKSLYTAWKTYLEELDKVSKARLSEFEKIGSICDTLKEMKSHKTHVGKKTIDQHLRRMQDEVMQSVNELEKHRKVYHEEEHSAKQARDKEDKLKKKKAGIFSKLSDLQTKKEKTSSFREASELQATAARNEYIMALAAANAHLHNFYAMDIPTLNRQLDDEALDKCKNFILSVLDADMNSVKAYFDAVKKSTSLVDSTSAEITNEVFLTDPASNCVREEIQIEFEPCDNDNVTTVSTEHNANLALQHDVTKWLSCFQKECRNIIRLQNQMVKCTNLVQSGHKTVEVRGVGVVNLETQIDEVRQQLRKCNVSKAKAQARLLAMKEGGMPIHDLDTVEDHIRSEMKTVTLDVESTSSNTLIAQPLSRTPSMRSTSNISDGRTSSAAERPGSEADTETGPTPGPDSSNYDQEDSDQEYEQPQQTRTSSSGAYDASAAGGWAGESWADDPTAAWGNESVPEPPPIVVETKYNEDQGQEVQQEPPPVEENYNQQSYPDYGNEPDAEYGGNDDANEGQEAVEEPIDGTLMVGKIVRALYPYPAQNDDELDIQEGEELTVVNAVDRDWVSGKNSQGQTGYIPAAYLEIVGDAPATETEYPPDQYDGQYGDVPTTETDYDIEKEYGVGDTQVMVTSDADYVKALYDYEASNQEEISFNEGDLIRIIERSEDGWWTGEKDGITGHFPSMLVAEMDDGEEEEDEDEGGEDLDEEVEEGAFEGSESGSVESGSDGGGGGPPSAPPPSFAPPKPIGLVPQQIVIMQPTPEVESKGTFGEDADDGIGEEQTSDQEQTDGKDVEPPPPPPPPPPPQEKASSDFVLEKPSRVQESEKEVESESIKPEEKEKSPEEELPPPPTPEQLQELDKSHGPKAQQSVESEAESKTETESESEANTVAEAPFEAQFEANFEADFDAKFDANFEPSPTPQTDPPADQKLSEAQTPNKSDQESDQEENTVHRKSSSDSSTSTELGVVNDEPLTDEDTEQLKNDEKKGEPKPKSDSEEEVDLK